MKNKINDTIDGTCVEVEGIGVLIRGPTGCGKSDLALRLIDEGAKLISDDYTEISNENFILVAKAPKNIRGLLEIRGIGVVKIKSNYRVKLSAIINLVKVDQIERMPEERKVNLCDVNIPVFFLNAYEASSVAKVRIIIRKIKGDITLATQEFKP